jgi:DNA/RNA endonuclease YhcR with UshA esterase domain
MKKISLALGVILLATITARLHADDATSQPATSTSTIDVTDTAKLKEMVGKSVTVKGEVTKVFAGKSVTLIDFKGNRDFTAVIRKVDLDAVNAGFGGDVTAGLKGKTILVTGEIKLYKDKPQIEVTKPEQIQLESK